MNRCKIIQVELLQYPSIRRLGLSKTQTLRIKKKNARKKYENVSAEKKKRVFKAKPKFEKMLAALPKELDRKEAAQA